jgi:hypothetical protein
MLSFNVVRRAVHVGSFLAASARLETTLHAIAEERA